MFATLGINVTVVDGREVVLDFVDAEIIEALLVSMRKMGTTFPPGREGFERDEGTSTVASPLRRRVERTSTRTRCSTPSDAR